MLYVYRARPSSLICFSCLVENCLLEVFGPPPDPSFFSSLTLSAYLSVFKVCAQQLEAGEMLAIIVVFELPVKESFRTCVSLLPLNGVCFLSRSKALMHSFSAKRDLLISAPYILVVLSDWMVSAPRSLPAKSMNDILE